MTSAAGPEVRPAASGRRTTSSVGADTTEAEVPLNVQAVVSAPTELVVGALVTVTGQRAAFGPIPSFVRFVSYVVILL